MFSKNLKYYRLKNNLSKTALASMVGISTMSITHYENGDRRPDMTTIKALATALGVRTIDFLSNRNSNLVFVHAQFKKRDKLSLDQQEYIRESVEEYFSRFFDIVEILGGVILPAAPPIHTLPLLDTPEENAQSLRQYLHLALSGPIGNLTKTMEALGILVYFLDYDNDGFYGMNGTVNEYPYIVINRNMSADYIQSTLIHELAHFAFAWSENLTSRNVEKLIEQITEAFLLPLPDAQKELGMQRTAVSFDMILVCNEYNISLPLLVERAHRCRIISQTIYKNYCQSVKQLEKFNSKCISIEEPQLFSRLVYRAVSEGEISIEKGAELLKCSYREVEMNCKEIGEIS